ncbi:MAG: hypothetical protein ABI378_00610 [Chitinophagaceae bacterium]
MNLKTLLSISILLLVEIGCQKDPQDTAPRIPISDQRLKDAATAKIGSYFVYQDSATGVTDSFFVNYSSTSYYRYSSSAIVYHEIINYSATNDSLTGTGLYQPAIKVEAYENALTLGIESHKLSVNGCAVILPFANGIQFKIDQTEGIGLNLIDNFAEKGHSYGAVYEILAHSYNYNQNTFLHSWFSLTNGLVKFNLSKGDTSFTYYQLRNNIKK